MRTFRKILKRDWKQLCMTFVQIAKKKTPTKNQTKTKLPIKRNQQTHKRAKTFFTDLPEAQDMRGLV